uniref:Uncharacterized protein n=1 Tax=Chaetoceros debilis TaxID=122233 RepID=A0A7S3Q2W6_9STRA
MNFIIAISFNIYFITYNCSHTYRSTFIDICLVNTHTSPTKNYQAHLSEHLLNDRIHDVSLNFLLSKISLALVSSAIQHNSIIVKKISSVPFFFHFQSMFGARVNFFPSLNYLIDFDRRALPDFTSNATQCTYFKLIVNPSD